MRKALGSNPSVSIFAAAQKKTRVAFGSRRADLLHSSAPSPMQGLSFMNCGQDWQVGGRVSLRLGIKFKRSPPRGWRKAHPVQISSSRLHACRNCLALVLSRRNFALQSCCGPTALPARRPVHRRDMAPALAAAHSQRSFCGEAKLAPRHAGAMGLRLLAVARKLTAS